MIIEAKEYLYKLSNSAASPYEGATGCGFRKPVCYNVEKKAWNSMHNKCNETERTDIILY